MSELAFDEKCQALESLSQLTVSYQASRWFARLASAEIAGDGMLSSLVGRGDDPTQAVEELWSIIIALPSDKYIAIKAFTDERRNMRWNGFMWNPVFIDENAA